MLTIFGMILLTSPVLGGYKEEHEGFVKNFKGTSAFFVVICLAHLPASILLLKIVQGSSKPLFIRDFVCLVLPLLLNMTILADYCYLTIFLLIGGEIVYILRFNPYREKKVADNDMNLRCSLPGGSLLSSIARCKRMAYLNLFKGNHSIYYCDYYHHSCLFFSIIKKWSYIVILFSDNTFPNTLFVHNFQNLHTLNCFFVFFYFYT